MNTSGMNRREFQQLTLAALSGVVAGTAIGCNNGAGTPAAKPSGAAAPGPESTSAAPANATPTNAAPAVASIPGQITLSAGAEALILDEVHTCRGLNSCKHKGRDKENECAGQGTCASIADANCSGQNECKGQGGCGTNPNMNDCRGKGGCHVPLMSSAWETARTAFETAMKKNEKPFGPAPEKK